jgi:hypothetical protein
MWPHRRADREGPALITDPSGRAPEAGWYRDPAGRAGHRWWDGSGWTTTVADGGITRHDLFGVPMAPPPHEPAAAGPPISGVPDPIPPRSRSTLVTVTVAALLMILFVALLVLVHRGDDRAAADAKARSDLSVQVSSLSEQDFSLSRDESSLSAQVDELSSSAFPQFTDFSSFTDFGSTVDACTLVLPDDVAAALGAIVTTDSANSFGPVCFLATGSSSGGTMVIVNVSGPFDDLKTELRNNVPGTFEPRPVAVGDEAYVLDAFGVAIGIAAKGDQYVVIEVESGAGLPTDDQMVQLLTVAIARL